MKYLLLLILLLLGFSCKKNTKTTEVNNQKSEKKEIIIDTDVVENQENRDTAEFIESENEFEEDCIFDQTTQTDEFLNGIEEFSGYSWNQEERTATILLENLDTLLIRRGGCNHFGVSVEFRLKNDSIDYNEISNVYKKALWAAKLLESEFAYEEMKNEIDSSKTIIDNYNNIDNVYFLNEYLQDNHYSILHKVENDMTIILLGYYIN